MGITKRGEGGENPGREGELVPLPARTFYQL